LVVTVRLLHGHERTDERTRGMPHAPAVLAVSERYSVDELHAVARLSGRDGFPGVPIEEDEPRSPRERAVVNQVVLRSLADVLSGSYQGSGMARRSSARRESHVKTCGSATVRIASATSATA
jgi:hypothetical protein